MILSYPNKHAYYVWLYYIDMDTETKSGYKHQVEHSKENMRAQFLGLQFMAKICTRARDD